MYRIDVSAGKDNYSQRNNELQPYESCNTTSLTMAASYIPKVWKMFVESRFYDKYSQFPQPEDRLRQALLDWKFSPEIHNDLMIGFNQFLGSFVDSFNVSVPLSTVIKDLRRGLPVVMSGTFPGHPVEMKVPYGHIVCVVGAEWPGSSASGMPANWVIDDPFGDTMNNWRGSGNGVRVPHALFNQWMKSCGDAKRKWAHRFKV